MHNISLTGVNEGPVLISKSLKSLLKPPDFLSHTNHKLKMKMLGHKDKDDFLAPQIRPNPKTRNITHICSSDYKTNQFSGPFKEDTITDNLVCHYEIKHIQTVSGKKYPISQDAECKCKLSSREFIKESLIF